MEDFQEQEYEFLRTTRGGARRSAHAARRGLAAGAGLTVLRCSPAALAARGEALADAADARAARSSSPSSSRRPRRKAGSTSIALPPDWANYGEIISTFSKKYGIPITSANPDASLGRRRTRPSGRSRATRGPRTCSTSARRSRSPARTRVSTPSTSRRTSSKVPRAMKDGRGFWVGDYWGVDLVRRQHAPSSATCPRSWKDLLKPEYKNKVALNGSPLTSGSAVAGVFSAAIANGGGAQNIGPGIDFFAQLKRRRQLHPRAGDAADDRLGPDPDHDRLGLPQPRLREGVPGREDHGR